MTNKEQEDENLHKADQVYFLYDPQPVRLLDVIYVGPVMIYAGFKGKNLNAFVKWSLIGVGICTILYNGANFFINEKKAMEKRKADKALKDELNNFVPEPLENEEKMTQNIVEDNRPQQVPVEQPENVTIIEEDKIKLPADVLELIQSTGNPPIVKKGRGRPSIKAGSDESLLFQKNGNNIERS